MKQYYKSFIAIGLEVLWSGACIIASAEFGHNLLFRFVYGVGVLAIMACYVVMETRDDQSTDE